MSTGLTWHLENEILILKFSNPKQASSFSPADARVLRQAMDTSKFCGVLLSGVVGERNFCGGGDLKFYSSLKTKAAGIKANREIRKAFDELAALDVPTACVVTGDCFGGGLELLGCFDQVLSVPHSMFGFWQRRIGLSYGWGGGNRLRKRLRDQKLVELSASTRLISAHEAHALGLVDEVVFAPMVEERAREWLFQAIQFETPILKDFKNEVSFFEKLWLTTAHKNVLQKFK